MDPIAVYFVIAGAIGIIALALDASDRRRRKRERNG